MKLLNLNETEIETMSYDDVAYLILEKKHKKMKIQDLFKIVLNEMNLNDSLFETHIADFFELLSTDKRFIMLEKGFWDLKVNHAVKIVIDDDDDDLVIQDAVENDISNDDDEEINFDEETIDDDDAEDDLKDLVIVDDEDENEVL